MLGVVVLGIVLLVGRSLSKSAPNPNGNAAGNGRGTAEQKTTSTSDFPFKTPTSDPGPKKPPARTTESVDAEDRTYTDALATSKSAQTFEAKVKPILDYLDAYSPNGKHVGEAKQLLSNLSKMSYFSQAWAKSEEHFKEAILAPIRKDQDKFMRLGTLDEVDKALAQNPPAPDRAVVRVVEALLAMTAKPPQYKRSMDALEDARSVYDAEGTRLARSLEVAVQALCLYNLQFIGYSRMRCDAFRAMTESNYGAVAPGVIRTQIGLIGTMLSALASATDGDQEWEQAKRPLVMALAALRAALQPLAEDQAGNRGAASPDERLSKELVAASERAPDEAAPPRCNLCGGAGIVEQQDLDSKRYPTRGFALLRAQELNRTDEDTFNARLGVNRLNEGAVGGIDIANPVWIPYLLNDGTWAAARGAPRTFFCSCAEGRRLAARDEERRRAAQEQAANDAARRREETQKAEFERKRQLALNPDVEPVIAIRAMVETADAYAAGAGTGKDPKEASAWLEKAADRCKAMLAEFETEKKNLAKKASDLERRIASHDANLQRQRAYLNELYRTQGSGVGGFRYDNRQQIANTKALIAQIEGDRSRDGTDLASVRAGLATFDNRQEVRAISDLQQVIERKMVGMQAARGPTEPGERRVEIVPKE